MDSNIAIFANLLLISITIFRIAFIIRDASSLNLIGHLRNWKKVKYPKFFLWFLDETLVGKDLLLDCTTYFQTITMLIFDFSISFFCIAFAIYKNYHFSSSDYWVFYIDISLFAYAIIRNIVLTSIAKKEYKKYLLKKLCQCLLLKKGNR